MKLILDYCSVKKENEPVNYATLFHKAHDKQGTQEFHLAAEGQDKTWRIHTSTEKIKTSFL